MLLRFFRGGENSSEKNHSTAVVLQKTISNINLDATVSKDKEILGTGIFIKLNDTSPEQVSKLETVLGHFVERNRERRYKFSNRFTVIHNNGKTVNKVNKIVKFSDFMSGNIRIQDLI